MTDFIIIWDQVTYSVPSVGSVRHKGKQITLNEYNGKSILTPKGSKPIIADFGEFFDLDGNRLPSISVKESFEPYKV
jgi:hypothetical protein